MEQLNIIKIGGNVIDSEPDLSSFLQRFAQLKQKKILVHGGGKVATAIGNKLQIESKYIDGRRITDDDTIDLVTMVYGGLINKKIVAKLQSLGCDGLGVTGADAMLLPAVKRPVKEVDYGWAGDIAPSDLPVAKWKKILDWHLCPVVAPLTCNAGGQILNTNADTIAAALAISLSGQFDVSLFFCFEKRGVLADVDNEDSFIRELSLDLFNQLKQENKISKGILPKLKNAFDAKNQGVENVLIGSSENLSALIKYSEGTRII